MMRSRWKFLVVPPMIVLAIFVMGEVVMRLWNWLLPPLFGWHTVTFWQAFGLLVLCRILFGGFGGHDRHRRGDRKRLRERWNQMSPEERDRLRQGLRGRCGPFPDTTPETRESI
jgi:hypothetical protein